MANADCIKKVRDIILSDPSLGYVVVSAPGKRAKTDTKVTDLLYAALDKVKHGHSADVAFEPVKSRFDAIISELGIGLDLTEDYDEITAALTDNATRDYVASRGEYLSAKVLAALLDWKFIDAKDFIRFDDNGNFLSEETNAYAKAMLRSVKYAVIPGFYGSTDKGEIKTFSRGGSDISGSIVARAVYAGIYENWTDVDGFMKCDPRIRFQPRNHGTHYV